MISGIGGSDYYSSFLRNQVSGRFDSSEMFETTDTDDSGGISQEELEDWIGAMSNGAATGVDITDAVSTYDADGDGELNGDELKTFLTDSGAVSPAFAGDHAPSSAGPASGGGSGGSNTALSEYDLNEDGVLSASELQAYMDDMEEKNPQLRMHEAISSYEANSEENDPLIKQSGFMDTGGSGSYGPIDIPV